MPTTENNVEEMDMGMFTATETDINTDTDTGRETGH
jgi:hypothetical protein